MKTIGAHLDPAIPEAEILSKLHLCKPAHSHTHLFFVSHFELGLFPLLSMKDPETAISRPEIKWLQQKQRDPCKVLWELRGETTRTGFRQETAFCFLPQKNV